MPQQKYLRPIKQLGCSRSIVDGSIIVVYEDHSADIENQHTLKMGEPLRGYLKRVGKTPLGLGDLHIDGWKFIYHPEGDAWLLRDHAECVAGAQALIDMQDGTSLIVLEANALLRFNDAKVPYVRFISGQKMDTLIPLEKVQAS